MAPPRRPSPRRRAFCLAPSPRYRAPRRAEPSRAEERSGAERSGAGSAAPPAGRRRAPPLRYGSGTAPCREPPSRCVMAPPAGPRRPLPGAVVVAPPRAPGSHRSAVDGGCPVQGAPTAPALAGPGRGGVPPFPVGGPRWLPAARTGGGGGVGSGGRPGQSTPGVPKQPHRVPHPPRGTALLPAPPPRPLPAERWVPGAAEAGGVGGGTARGARCPPAKCPNTDISPGFGSRGSASQPVAVRGGMSPSVPESVTQVPSCTPNPAPSMVGPTRGTVGLGEPPVEFWVTPAVWG